MLLNGPKLVEFLGLSEAPLLIQCPKCADMFTRTDWWPILQNRDLTVTCVCGATFTIPQYSPEHYGVRMVGKRSKRTGVTTTRMLLAYAAVGAVLWHAGRRPSGSFLSPSDRLDD
jgi:hypothetical protein